MGDVVKSTPAPVAPIGRDSHAISTLNAVKPKLNAVVALTSKTEGPAMDLLIMNANGPNGGPGTAERRKRVIQKTILDTKPHVVLLQEFKWKDVSGKTWNDSALPEYYEYFRNEEASILIDIREVVATEINQRNFRVILERLQSNPSNRLKVAFPTDFNPLPRMTMKKIQSKQNLKDVILVVSWHGRWNKRLPKGRKPEFEYLMEFLRQVKIEFNDIPLIVAGDFNINIDVLPRMTDPFDVTGYTASERRSKKGVKDYFIASKELCLTDMQYIDLDGVKGLSENDDPSAIFDHDPVKCKAVHRKQKSTAKQIDVHQLEHENSIDELPDLDSGTPTVTFNRNSLRSTLASTSVRIGQPCVPSASSGIGQPCVPSTSSGIGQPCVPSTSSGINRTYVDSLEVEDMEEEDHTLAIAIEASLNNDHNCSGTMRVEVADALQTVKDGFCERNPQENSIDELPDLDSVTPTVTFNRNSMRSTLSATSVRKGQPCVPSTSSGIGQPCVPSTSSGIGQPCVPSTSSGINRLLMKELSEGIGILEGSPRNMVFSNNIGLLESDVYKTAGKMFAWSPIFDGPGICCLNPKLFDQMLGRIVEEFSAEDIPDIDAKNKVQHVH